MRISNNNKKNLFEATEKRVGFFTPSMSDSDSSQRTGRSQPLPLTKFPPLHEADATTLSTDNAANIMPSLSHGEGRNYSAVVYKDHDPANATQHNHHSLPSLHIRTDIAGPVSMDAVKETDPFFKSKPLAWKYSPADPQSSRDARYLGP